MGNKKCAQIKQLPVWEAIQKTKMSDKPTFVLFKAEWCGACAQAKPEFQKAACELGDEIETALIDVDENEILANEFGVNEFPTAMIVQNGKVLKKSVGAYDMKKYVDMVRKLVKK